MLNQMSVPNALTITPSAFLRILSHYSSLTSSPESISKATASNAYAKTLDELDSWRVNTLPAILSGKTPVGNERRDPPHLTRAELEDLLKCKMKRGKFRPTLLPLVSSNNPSSVQDITRESFAILDGLKSGQLPAAKTITEALNSLSKNLKGVGPATASYILAAKMPDYLPAFSDEAFRWVFFDNPGNGVKGSKHDGWNRRMDYSLKEYLAFVERVREISERLMEEARTSEQVDEHRDGRSDRELFGAGSVEMVGWVLGKEAAGWTAGTNASSTTDDAGETMTGKLKRKAVGDAKSEDKTSIQDKFKSDSKAKKPKSKHDISSPLVEQQRTPKGHSVPSEGNLRRSSRLQGSARLQ